MNKILEVTITLKDKPNPITIYMSDDGHSVEEWSQLVQSSIDNDEFLELVCVQTTTQHVWVAQRIVHFSIKVLTKIGETKSDTEPISQE